MNLIEQLGGYEKSKRELKLKEEGSMFQCCTAITEDMIRDALLEHRRENDIFEEKDKIVFVDDFMHGEIMIVAWVRDGEVWIDDGAKRCTDLSMIRHATPQEIAQGYRDE